MRCGHFALKPFLPHALMGGDDEEPVIIGWSEPPLEQNDVLINTTGPDTGLLFSLYASCGNRRA